MHDIRVMSLVPTPDMRGAEHDRRPIIARGFVERCLSIVLAICRPRAVRHEVGGMPCDVMPVFVVQDSGIVRSVGAVASTRSGCQRSVLSQAPSRTQMNLPFGRYRLILLDGMSPGREPVMA